MFAAVMMKDDNCKKFLEMVLGISINKIVVNSEKSISHNPDYKGVRLDVYANDENNTRYDIEMQVAKQELGKRIRYYHSQMDMELLERGHKQDIRCQVLLNFYKWNYLRMIVYDVHQKLF